MDQSYKFCWKSALGFGPNSCIEFVVFAMHVEAIFSATNKLPMTSKADIFENSKWHWVVRFTPCRVLG